MTPLRILMLTWEFPPRIIGGISTHVYNLSRRLARKDVTVKVVTCDFPGAHSQEVIDGVEVFRVDSSLISQTDFLLWTYHLNSLMIEQGSQILERFSFDLIHAHDWLVGRAALELKRRYGLPVITTVHATETGRGNGIHNTYQKTIHNIEELLIRNSDRVICCSRFMVEHIQENFGIASEKVNLIPNAVDMTQFNRTPESSGASLKTADRENGSDRKLVLYVGRMVREKGVHILIDAFEKLQKERVNADLVIVGEGPVKDSLMRETQKRGLDRHVHFTGLVDQASLVKLYSSSHVFVLPSLYEPFGIAALEAMASGVPVVVSDSGGLAEIVENGVNGIKVPAEDPSSLSTALRTLLEDSSLADRLRKNAYSSLLERYNWDLVAEKTLEAYQQALTETKESPALVMEHFLTDTGLLSLLFTLGATRRNVAKTAREIAASIKALETPVKLILGRLASQGYVSVFLEHGSSVEVTYYLTESGIVKACSGFS